MLEVLEGTWQYLLVGPYPKGPLGGLALTIILAVLSLALTLPCAVLVALARTGGVRALALPASGFVHGVRSVPLLVVVFWAYFLAPVVLGFPVAPSVTLVFAIVVYQTAYLSEVIRGGIEALPPGQAEAARALGLHYGVTTWRVILPQALYNVLPGMLNQLTAIIKETSLGAIITAGELTYVAMQVNNILVTKPFEVFAILAAAYFLLCASLTQVSALLERRIARVRRGPGSPAAGTW